MNVEREKESFRFITITLESKEEIRMLKQALSNAQDDFIINSINHLQANRMARLLELAI